MNYVLGKCWEKGSGTDGYFLSEFFPFTRRSHALLVVVSPDSMTVVSWDNPFLEVFFLMGMYDLGFNAAFVSCKFENFFVSMFNG